MDWPQKSKALSQTFSRKLVDLLEQEGLSEPLSEGAAAPCI